MSVYIQVRVRSVTVHVSRLRRLATRVLRELGESISDVSISFVGDGHMRRLNRFYRGKNRTTDVLAFAMKDADIPRIRRPNRRPLGDVVISIPTAVGQAISNRKSLDEEIVGLLVHGMLHLCGYDHERSEAEARRMQRRERLLRRRLGTVPCLLGGKRTGL